MTFESNLFFKRSTGVLSLLLTTLLLSASCNNETTTVDVMNKHHLPYNPSSPVVIDSFSPESGKVATQMIIHGSNFGTDTAIIKVAIDTVPLHLISSSGNFAYIVVRNQHYILKSYYNRETKELEQPILFAGAPKQSGYKDGVGTSARFNQPHQGAFDEKGNFYLCDVHNHVIRKITPDGIVSTFAGRA